MSETVTLVEQISKLSILEVSELVKALEDKFGVKAAAPMAMMAGEDMLLRPQQVAAAAASRANRRIHRHADERRTEQDSRY